MSEKLFMYEVLQRIQDLKTELDAMPPLSSSLLAAIRKPYDFEITRTSNAVVGNTLTLRETREGIEHGEDDPINVPVNPSNILC